METEHAKESARIMPLAIKKSIHSVGYSAQYVYRRRAKGQERGHQGKIRNKNEGNRRINAGKTALSAKERSPSPDGEEERNADQPMNSRPFI